MKQKHLKMLVAVLWAVAPVLLLADPVTDRNIENTAKSSYNFRTVLDGRVKAKAQDGVVTLTGKVMDREQKSLAEGTVRSLPGVVLVKNEIVVDSTNAEQSDGWIALKIRSTLLLHANVSIASTDVAVHEGVVTLTGTAGSEAEKELTTAYAQDVAGVKDVKNEMQVRSAAKTDDPAGTDTFRTKIDDASITAQVTYELLTHHSTSVLKTSVETHNGVVEIRGRAGSAAERDLVSHLARSIKGVIAVDNQMIVQAAE